MVAGFAGGTVNAIAGGATFFTFPAMLAVGIPPVAANASNTVALVPASLVAAWAQRRELADAGLRRLPVLAALSLGGGVAGAVLLLRDQRSRVHGRWCPGCCWSPRCCSRSARTCWR